MSVVVFGKEFYGMVDRVPGEYHVATLFRHVQYVPLIPLGSYLVLEDERGRDTDRCIPIPWQSKSVTIGYVRGVLGGPDPVPRPGRPDDGVGVLLRQQERDRLLRHDGSGGRPGLGVDRAAELVVPARADGVPRP